MIRVSDFDGQPVAVEEFVSIAERMGALDDSETNLLIVTELGADMIQGYYYARPMEPEAFSDFIWGAHDPGLPE